MSRIRSDPTLSKELHIFPYSSCLFICCDTANAASPVSKVGVRQALYLAIDRQKLTTDVFQGIYSPAWTIVPPDIPGANPKAKLAGGVTEARKALAAAGYPGGKGVSLTFNYSQSANNDLLLQAIQQMWQEDLEIKLHLNPMGAKVYNAYFSTSCHQTL